jgi:hypothetical protein
MNPLRTMAAPFGRLWVSMALLIVLAGVTVGRIYLASSTRRQEVTAPPAAAAPPPVESSRAGGQSVSAKFGQKFADFILPPEPARKEEAGPPPVPEEVRKQFVNPATPISLFPPAPARAKTPSGLPATYYLPSFRLIHCELIAGPATGNIETPLIGVVLEDQVAIDPDGVTRVVIPAGVEVHGVGKPSPVRDRIDGAGAWTFVWRTNDGNNAMELTVNALALNRDYDPTSRVYGDNEKSPGILGRRIESASDRLLQSALLASAATLARELRSTTSLLNPLTSQMVTQAKPTAGNALLNAGAAGTDDLAQQIDAIRREIDEKGYYVAILPGKEFYLYTKEPIDLRNARRPQALVAEMRPAANANAALPGRDGIRVFPETSPTTAATP